MTENTPDTECGPIDFTSLVLGFSSATLSYLGISTDGQSHGTINKALAYQNIEIIKLLKEKTTGNLTTQEEELITEILKELMLRFSQVCSSTEAK